MAFTNQTRNAGTFTGAQNTGILSYLTTDVPEFVLVGSAETDVLILWGDTVFTNQSRN